MGLVERDLVAGKLDRLPRNLERVDSAAERMSELLDELLELSRIGRRRNPPEPCDLGELAREALTLVSSRIEERGMEVEIAEGMPTVVGDRARLREIFQNLIDNAAKLRYLSLGRQSVPMVIRLVIGRGWGQGPQHSQSLESLFAAIPGLKVAMPSAAADARDLLLASSVPVFVPDGLHHLESWNEAVCGGAWGAFVARIGEHIRRALDLEDWSAFHRSYAQMNELLDDLGDGDLRSIVLVAGDIHFSYIAGLESSGPVMAQVVSSPIRNALIPHERSVIRLAISRVGAAITSTLGRLARAPRSTRTLTIHDGPYFSNNMAALTFDDDGVRATMEHARPDDEDERPLLQVVAREDLVGRPSPPEDRAG